MRKIIGGKRGVERDAVFVLNYFEILSDFLSYFTAFDFFFEIFLVLIKQKGYKYIIKIFFSIYKTAFQSSAIIKIIAYVKIVSRP